MRQAVWDKPARQRADHGAGAARSEDFSGRMSKTVVTEMVLDDFSDNFSYMNLLLR